MTDDAIQKIEVTYVATVDVADDGRVRLTKKYADHKEQIVFDSVAEIEMILDEVADAIPREKCPICNGDMDTIYVKEYSCAACSQLYSDDGLEAWRVIERSKGREN